MSERMMTAWEICRSYRQAADKKAQLTILAELNACSKREICEILKDGGEDVDLRWAGRRNPKEETVHKDKDTDRQLEELENRLREREAEGPITAAPETGERAADSRPYEAGTMERRGEGAAPYARTVDPRIFPGVAVAPETGTETTPQSAARTAPLAQGSPEQGSCDLTANRGGPPRASAPAEATGDDAKPLTARELKELLEDVPDDAEIRVPERTVIKARTYVITERETGAKVDKPPRLELIFELKGGIILGHHEAV